MNKFGSMSNKAGNNCLIKHNSIERYAFGLQFSNFVVFHFNTIQKNSPNKTFELGSCMSVQVQECAKKMCYDYDYDYK